MFKLIQILWIFECAHNVVKPMTLSILTMTLKWQKTQRIATLLRSVPTHLSK